MTVRPVALRAAEARRLALHAQMLLGAPPKGGAVARVDRMLRGVGAVQLDTISVLARSHELVAYARLGAVGRDAVEGAYWGSGRAVEYWAHAASVVPIESWPWLAYKRRRYRESGVWSAHRVDPALRTEVLARVRGGGPLTATGLGGAKNGGAWWDWSPLKHAAEELLAEGELVCVERRGWRRVYDLAERAIPADLQFEPDDEASLGWMCAQAALRLGVGTQADIADYFRLRLGSARRGIAAADLVPVEVEGWTQAAFVHRDTLAVLEAPPRGRHRTTLLSPFDSLIWDHRRTERIFGFDHHLEAYVPAPRRVHGYYAMPLLARGALRGRVDPARAGRTLVARRTTVEPSAVDDMARALVEAASWVGCDAVAVEVVDPPEMAAPLRRTVRALS